MLGVAVCAAHRLVDDLVDQAQGLQAVSGNAHGIGRILGLVAGLPEDGSAAFRADYRVNRVLQHQHLVGHGNRQGAAGATFTNDGGDDGGLQLAHLVDVAANGFGLAALFSVNAGEGTGRVDKGEHWKVELLCGLHQAQRLAVALWLGHAKVAQAALLGVAALLVAQQHARRAVKARQTADDGQVIGEMPVAVHLDKVGKALAHIVQRVRTLDMAGNLGDLPGRQIAVYILGQLQAFLAQLLYFLGDIDRALGLHVAQFFDFCFQLGNLLFKIQKVLFCQLVSPCHSRTHLAFRAGGKVS